ncbi:MAG: hypothetical protein ABFD82_08970 [Syntrophaceae bacterium]
MLDRKFVTDYFEKVKVVTSQKVVTPEKTGVQTKCNYWKELDSGSSPE